LTQAILQWEVKWNQMMRDQPGGTSIPELWRMAALMKMCPKEIKHNIELSWDTIDEKYSVMREKVIMWATNAAEKMGEPVAMDVGCVEGGQGRRGRVGRGLRGRRCGRGIPDDEVLLLSRVRSHG